MSEIRLKPIGDIVAAFVGTCDPMVMLSICPRPNYIRTGM